MGQNPMGNGMGYPRQNLLRQLLRSPQVQNRVPNLMRGFQKFMPPFGQGGGISPFGRGALQNQGMNFPGNIPPGPGGNFQRSLEVQPPSLNSSPVQPAPIKPSPKPTRAGGLIRDLLGRLGIGK